MALANALVMCMMMSATAFAASITLNRDDTYTEGDVESNTNKYYAYKIFDATKATTGVGNTTDESIEAQAAAGYVPATGISYFVKTGNPWKATLEGTNLFDFTEAADGSGWTIALKSTVTNDEATAKTIASALNAALTATTPISLSGEYAAKELTIGTALSVDDGYYLITSDLGENLVLATSDITITEKNEYPDVTKEVAEEDESAQIGDVIDYTLTVYVPEGANQQIVLTDTMTKGLTFKEITSVTVPAPTDEDANATAAVSYTNTTAAAVTGDTTGKTSFTITFADTVVKANQGKTITIVYKATLNKDAVVGSSESTTDGNDNTVKLNYGNKYESKPVTVETDTQSFSVDKVDGTDSTKKLSGAVFELYIATHTTTDEGASAKTTATIASDAQPIALVKEDDADGKEVYRVATTGDTNTVTSFTTAGKEIVIKGVDADVKYALRETTAPAGYNKLEDPVAIAPNTLNTLDVDVPNNSGSVLPSTGGIGTTIFYVIGAVLVIGAGILLVTRRRMRTE